MQGRADAFQSILGLGLGLHRKSPFRGCGWNSGRGFQSGAGFQAAGGIGGAEEQAPGSHLEDLQAHLEALELNLARSKLGMLRYLWRSKYRLAPPRRALRYPARRLLVSS